jgi:uncharacterized protein (TIGR02284 family)
MANERCKCKCALRGMVIASASCDHSTRVICAAQQRRAVRRVAACAHDSGIQRVAREVNAMTQQDVISTLNSLIETCRDGEAGFREAARNVANPVIQAAFVEIADERTQLRQELAEAVRRLGGAPEEGGSVSGAVHRGWMNLKSTVTGKDDVAILAEAERGEDVAVAAYRKALERSLPPDVDAIVRRQYIRVQAAHDRVRAFETAGR